MLNNAKNLWNNLWNDEGGALLSAELVLIMTLLICALAVGLSALRVAIVTELADVAAAVGALNQSFSVGGITGHHASCSAQAWTDMLDSCDVGCTQAANDNSQCVTVCTTTTHAEMGTPFTDNGVPGP